MFIKMAYSKNLLIIFRITKISMILRDKLLRKVSINNRSLPMINLDKIAISKVTQLKDKPMFRPFRLIKLLIITHLSRIILK